MFICRDTNQDMVTGQPAAPVDQQAGLVLDERGVDHFLFQTGVVGHDNGLVRLCHRRSVELAGP